MNTKFVKFALVAIVLTGLSMPAWAQDTLTVTPGTSSGGVTPIQRGSPSEWFYAYCLPKHGSIKDTIPVAFSIADTDGFAGQTYTITLSSGEGNLSGSVEVAVGNGKHKKVYPLPYSFTLTDNSTTTTEYLYLNTSTGGVANVEVSASPALTINGVGKIHIHVFKRGAVCAGAVSTGECFLTSSEFDYLTPCNSTTPVDTGGAFAIVANAANTIVSTNPGQFYYNLVWQNTSKKSRAVTVTLSATNLLTHGAEPIHMDTFASSGFALNVTNFDYVNDYGTACGQNTGSYNSCAATVPAGQILWVTWHLTFSEIGGPSSGIPSTCCSTSTATGGVCPANPVISVEGELSDSKSGTLLMQCLSSATGYLKGQ